MPVVKRNMLCLKKKENLDLGHVILYEPYKKILIKFYELATNPKAVEFDPVSRAFDGLESVSDEFKSYYEAMLGVTSYYQHSQGGKGKLIEKRLSSIVETCVLNLKISEFPLWFENPGLYRKRGILTISGLSAGERRLLRLVDWNYLEDRDETIDIGNLITSENTIILLELKNRVDSGGTAGRREIWQSKFRTILEFMRVRKLFERAGRKFSLAELIKSFGFLRLEMYLGVLFDTRGRPATLIADREEGFYSTNREGLDVLFRFAKQNRYDVVEIDEDKLRLVLKKSAIEIEVGAIYGNDIPKRLFRRNYSVSDLLMLRYDDIWLSQLVSIWERAFLLEYGKNFTTMFRQVLLRDKKARQLYDRLIETEGHVKSLKNLVSYLLTHHSRKFPKRLCPRERDREGYLSDIVQFVGAVEA